MAESIITTTAEALWRSVQSFRRDPQPFRRDPLPSELPRLDLSRVLESEVIPRLQRPPIPMRAPPPTSDGSWEEFDAFVRSPALPAAPEIAERDVVLVASALLKQDMQSAWRMLKLKHDAGLDTERIAVELLGPVACHLGEAWVADRCSFADVTLGTGYLHQLLRELTTCLDLAAEVPGYHHRALLLPAPGEQHVFGLSILGESFRRRGWDVCGGPGQDRAELLELIRRESFDVIGFSVGVDRWLEDLSMDIERFRGASRNRGVRILVGGNAIDRAPNLTAELGAHASVTDPRLAPDKALALL